MLLFSLQVAPQPNIAAALGYANQAKQSEEAVPYAETEKMISALLSENAYLKGQLQRYILENEELKRINFLKC